MKQITLKEKSVYGNVWLYPVCEQAYIFASLIGKKTFSANDVDLIASLGYNVTIQAL